MSFLSYGARRLKAAVLLMVTVMLAALMLGGCGVSNDEYAGTWMGIDEQGNGNSKIYQYTITPDDSGYGYMIEVVQSDYTVNINHSQARWRSTSPHYFNAQMNANGDLVSDIGVIRADPANFRLIYGNIYLVRKAKNTEVKLKYVARREIESMYPGIMIAD